MVFQNDILAGAAGAGGGYEIEYSARLTVDNSFLKATTDFNGSGNTQYWTVSFWAKRADLTKFGIIHSSTVGGATYYQDELAWNSGANLNKIVASYGTNASAFTQHNSSGVYRDPSAWAHYCIQNNNFGVTVWVNNEVALSFTHGGSYRYLISSSYDYRINSYEYQSTPNGTTDWYIADYYLILDSSFGASDIYGPDQFAEYNDAGVWVPKENSLTTAQFGEDGCFMEFKQSGTSGATASDIGADTSGQDNHMQLVGTWTSDDQVVDTPTDNYATWNPLRTGANIIPSDGNLKAVTNATVAQTATGTFGLSSGKWYWEVTNQGGFIGYTGIVDETHDMATYIGGSESGYAYNTQGEKVGPTSGTTAAYGATYTTGDVIGVALDMDAGTLAFYKNGASQGTAFTGLTGMWFPAVSGNGVAGKGGDADFGQLGFTHTPPTGFKALSTANLPTPAIKDGSAYFQTSLYSGNSSTQEINQSGNSTFQPDFVWIKERNRASSHVLTDAVRGINSQLSSNLTNAEGTATDAVTTFDSDGFSLGDGSELSAGAVNTTGYTYAAWQWLAANGTASNTNGSITSTVSANTTAGFSIVRAASMASGTIGHGLSQAPDMVIGRMQSEVFNWWVWHQGLSGGTYSMKLNDDSAQAAVATVYTAEPTSTVINTGGSWTSGNPAIFYCFHEVEGFSKFGSYTGNGSTDGPFVWCGFRPAFVIAKRTNSADNWAMYDAARDPYNVTEKYLLADLTNAEATFSTAKIDFLSNGFKWRGAVNFGNASGGTYIFMAFAEHPFGGDGVAPVPAR